MVRAIETLVIDAAFANTPQEPITILLDGFPRSLEQLNALSQWGIEIESWIFVETEMSERRARVGTHQERSSEASVSVREAMDETALIFAAISHNHANARVVDNSGVMDIVNLRESLKN
jgi:hypothetical protein